MKDSKKPNLKAPRFFIKRYNTLSNDRVSSIKEKTGSTLSELKIKSILESFNELIAETVIDKRDGVDLPENIGNIFIGTCLPKIRKNVDFKVSMEHLKVIEHRNWESDKYLAKIFYTNSEIKYKFKNHELWGFKAARLFSRELARTYPINWKKYIQVDHTLKVAKLFRKNSYKLFKADETQRRLNVYDELSIE